MIKFLQDYRTEALPPEEFKKGQEVSREETSERYFVGRGLAGYIVDRKLVDADHRPIVIEPVVVEVVRPGERRADLAVRAGEVMTGQPPRATSGPGVPFVEAATGVDGAPPVVLEAEIERLKLALATSEDLFRDMNNSHVEAADELRSAVDGLKREISDANAARDQAIKDLTDLRTQHDSIVAEYKGAREEFDKRGDRIVELEGLLKAADPTRDGASDTEAPLKTGKTKA